MWALVDTTCNVKTGGSHNFCISSLSQPLLLISLVFCICSNLMEMMTHVTDYFIYVKPLSNLINNFKMFIFSLLSCITLEKCSISESSLSDYWLHTSIAGHYSTKSFSSFSNEFNIILNNCLANCNLMDFTIAYTFYNIIYNVFTMSA